MQKGIIIALLGLVAGAAAWNGECKADILFVMDQSTSILPAYFKQQQKFIKDLITMFNVGKDKTRVGLVKFSDDARMVFSLKRFTEKKYMFMLIDHIKQHGGSTNTGEAMRVARTHAITQEYGARLDDPSVPEIVIVITDGNSQDKESTIHESRLLREAGTTVFAIGVGSDVSQAELETIASGEELIFKVDTYEALAGIKERLGNQACSVEPTVPPESIIPECQNKRMDVAIVLDASSDASEEDFHEMKSLARAMLYSFQIDVDLTRVAVISYADSTEAHSKLNEFNQRGKLSNKINEIRQSPGKSNTAEAFKALRSIFDPRYGARTQIAKAALFITNTKSAEFGVAVSEAEALYTKFGVEIFAVTVGKEVDAKEWKSLTGGKVVHRESYDGLPNLELRNGVAANICPVQPPPQDFPCGEKNPADIVFALDTMSAGTSGLSSISSFMRSVAGELEIGPEKIQVSVVKNPCHQVNGFNLDAHDNKTELAASLTKEFRMSTTKILNKLVDESFTEAKGAREASKAKRFAVLFIDGTPGNQKEVEMVAERAKREGNIEIFVVGIGHKVRKESLEGIATSPRHVHIVDTYESLEGNKSPANLISDTICKIKPGRTFEREI